MSPDAYYYISFAYVSIAIITTLSLVIKRAQTSRVDRIRPSRITHSPVSHSRVLVLGRLFVPLEGKFLSLVGIADGVHQHREYDRADDGRLYVHRRREGYGEYGDKLV